MRKMDENLNRCKNLQMLKIKVDRNRKPPKCSRCPYFQPNFRYRSCLKARCPFGKGEDSIFRKHPLKKEKICRQEVVR